MERQKGRGEMRRGFVAWQGKESRGGAAAERGSDRIDRFPEEEEEEEGGIRWITNWLITNRAV